MPVHIAKYASTNGDGTGTVSAIGDYSGSPVTRFYVEPPAGQSYSITRLLWSCEDTGMSAAEYGGIAALTIGVKIYTENSAGDLMANLTEESIKSNGDWSKTCYDLNLTSYGAGNEVMTARWTFTKMGTSIKLQSGQKIVVELADNFTGLVDHKFLFQGTR